MTVVFVDPFQVVFTDSEDGSELFFASVLLSFYAVGLNPLEVKRFTA